MWIFFVTDVTHSLALAGPNCIIWRLCHSPSYDQYAVIELADKLYNSVTVCFLCEAMKFHPDKQLFQVVGTGD